jgi:molybdopterin/thiamine biosynthesis adenylyltransferase
MKHYNFDPFKHIPKDQATAGALRALSPDVDVVTRTGRLADARDLAQWNSIISGVASAAKS